MAILGSFKRINKIIGNHWKIIGKVIEGDKRGREIGFPTANIMMDNIIKPNFGVYAVNIEFKNDLIEEEQEKIAKKHGYEIVDHKLVLYVKPIDGEK